MMKGSDSNKKCLHLMFSQTKNFVIFLVSTLLISIVEVFLVVIVKSFVEQVVVTKLFTKISLHVVPFVLSFFALCLFMIVRNNSKVSLTTKVSGDLIKDAHNSILNAELSEVEKVGLEDTTKKIVKNSEFIANNYLLKNILPFIEMIISIFVFIIASFVVQPVLALMLTLTLPFYFLAVKGVELFNQRFIRLEEEVYADSEARINHTFKKIKNIKLMNGLPYEKDLFENINCEHIRAKTNRDFLHLISSIVLYVLFVGLNISTALGLGGVLFRSSSSTVSSGAFVFYAVSVPIIFLTTYRAMHYHLLSSYIEKEANELSIISSLRTEVRSEPVTNLDEIHSLKFRDVVCVNADNEKVLNNLSFELKKSEKLGVLSLNKESKDAIFNSLTKIYKPKDGSILINNCDISKINTIYLRSIIATIYDKSCVFEQSIMDNIIYPDTFDEYKYNDALYRSGLKDIIAKLPDRDQTIITESFFTSEEDSEEIINRIIFANAFYKDAKIYVLDDATVNCCPAIESELLNEVAKLKNKIVVTLTDKAYLLNKYDKILVINDGEPVEYGKYEELMANKESAFYKAIKKAPSRKVKVS